MIDLPLVIVLLLAMDLPFVTARHCHVYPCRAREVPARRLCVIIIIIIIIVTFTLVVPVKSRLGPPRPGASA